MNMVKMKEEKNIYIFGSTGFVGCQLLTFLKQTLGGNVVPIARQGEVLSIDLEQPPTNETLQNIAPNSYFIFLAGISSPELCDKNPEHAETVNLDNTTTLINLLLAKNIHVIFASTDAVFGCKEGIAFDKDAPDPLGKYGLMKATIEARFNDESLFKSIRFSYVLSQNDKFSKYLQQCAAEQTLVDVYKGFSRNIVALVDVLDGIKCLIEQWDSFPHSAINFSGSELLAREELVSLMTKYYLISLDYEVAEAPDGFWDHRAKKIETDNSVFKKLLGREPLKIESLIASWE